MCLYEPMYSPCVSRCLTASICVPVHMVPPPAVIKACFICPWRPPIFHHNYWPPIWELKPTSQKVKPGFRSLAGIYFSIIPKKKCMSASILAVDCCNTVPL